MKTRSIFFVIALLAVTASFAQLPKLAVISLDVQAEDLENQNLKELVRIELSKHSKYQIIDRYEVNEALEGAEISANECFSKSCLVKAGQLVKSDKVVSGNIDKMGEAMYVRVRIIDVKTESIEKEVVKQFLYLPEKITPMLAIAVNELMGVPSDKLLESSLTSEESYENAVNNPHYNVLNLEGPRMGYSFLTGDAAQIFKDPVSKGGYNGYPALFQFGYQFEKQYLNEGKFQALFEFIPMVSGLDQGLFIPSLTVMNGLRNNINGIEFAIGPSFNVIKQSKQFQVDGVWYPANSTANPTGAEEVYRMDSRGSLALRSYVVIAGGFSLRSGKMNIPINAFFIPSKDSPRFGLSFGFNAKG